ncbi:MAG TPA: class I SAM-dependent methyltransferase [Trebonia sp.]|jgi:demethylmenaquinone methyltransferase/2-methoxy-6-polyprenyl-1,4-benzoquinol methylase|nr:class I SAM-dependent methyltransferase [Trebonia sp.]
MTPADDPAGLNQVLAEQRAYYHAYAREYLAQEQEFPGTAELGAAIDAFGPTGSVLELACGPGTWTARLLRHASSLTGVDASREMLALAAAQAGNDRARFIEADLFAWEPDQQYDVVFIGFWLSHVPEARFASFWSMVDRALRPGGRVLIVDDGHRSPDELIEGEQSTTIARQVTDGTSYRLVKVPLTAASVEQRLRRLGWDVAATQCGPFFWATATRA